MAIERLRIHVAIAHGRQRLHAEKEAIIKPIPTSGARNTILLETVERGEKKVESDVKTGDKRRELPPAQTEQPTIDIPPPPCVRIDFDKLDLAGAEGNGNRFPFHVYLIRSSFGRLVNKSSYGLEDLSIDIFLSSTRRLKLAFRHAQRMVASFNDV